MEMAIVAPAYTMDDLDRFPNDGNRYELLDGALLVTPAPSQVHQVIVSRIQARLIEAVMAPRIAEVVGPGVIVVPPRTQLEPDLLVYPARYSPKLHWSRIEEHWLAVEVLSRSSRIYDREFKRDAYLALGVREVWLVDWWNEVVEVCREPGPGELVRDVLDWRPPTLDTVVEIDLMSIFEGLD